MTKERFTKKASGFDEEEGQRGCRTGSRGGNKVNNKLHIIELKSESLPTTIWSQAKVKVFLGPRGPLIVPSMPVPSRAKNPDHLYSLINHRTTANLSNHIFSES